MPFVLIIIGVLLITINYRALKKEDGSFEKILEQRGERVEEHDIEIGNLRREFSETILELQLEIERLKAIKNSEESDDNKSGAIDYRIDDEVPYEEPVSVTKNSNKNMISDKARSVKELLDKGFTDDQICEELAIGKGEVLLIKGLYKK
ncbi:hypothetical protein [Clostridium folliculivorans]|uniref:Uncharacterized protein n=1 Tax=Clostridium folliculivorans TaxID=2886038 RepID=A0A9W5XZ04_9CLOT|nr:hypothetical protein [Clostridium folliculivorans]GKU23593.1 hypothetical protein CFOLD11_04190 [Clostridium folliculivorans]GKU29709.1 hypothetical protein CFB3_18160 [Clostridium folliculivorans]